MAKTIWDDEESFRDGAPEFKNGNWQEPETYTPAPEDTLKQRKVPQVVYEEEDLDLGELTDQLIDEEEEDFTEVLSDARLRLEQGKLYEMIMNHDLFSDVDADPRAAKSVQKQIRNWAKTQMEIMLGMRLEASQETAGIVSPPFNDLEVTILKKLASAASKGATESEEANTPVQIQTQPKKKTLNSIGTQRPKHSPKPIQKKAEPIQRKPRPKMEPPHEFEMDYEPLDKPIHKMTAAELQERDRQAAERQKNRKSAPPTNAAPMPDYATMEMLATAQVHKATGGVSGAGVAGLNGKLSSLILSGAIKKV